jgi:hypothetical protein
MFNWYKIEFLVLIQEILAKILREERLSSLELMELKCISKEQTWCLWIITQTG